MDTHCHTPIDASLVDAFVLDAGAHNASPGADLADAHLADADLASVHPADVRPARVRPGRAPDRGSVAPGAPPADGSRRGPPRQQLGLLGERIAAHHLTVVHGCSVLATNWRIADEQLRGELDLVVIDPRDAAVVICEVKTRRDAARFGGAVAALGPRQQMRIRRLAARFLATAELGARSVRFDVVAVDLGARAALTHLVDAW